MTNDEGKKRRAGKNPKWLKQSLDDVIADDVVTEPLDIETVARHLLEYPKSPMPKDHIDVLSAWLEDYNGYRLARIGSGPDEAEWYSLAGRLVENGLTIRSACEHAEQRFGLELDISDLETMFKRHRRKRSTQAKNIETLAKAILSGNDYKIEKASEKGTQNKP